MRLREGVSVKAGASYQTDKIMSIQLIKCHMRVPVSARELGGRV